MAGQGTHGAATRVRAAASPSSSSSAAGACSSPRSVHGASSWRPASGASPGASSVQRVASGLEQLLAGTGALVLKQLPASASTTARRTAGLPPSTNDE